MQTTLLDSANGMSMAVDAGPRILHTESRRLTLLSSCTLRPEWTWFVIKGFRSISANVVVLIDRIIVLNDRKISPRPLCNGEVPHPHAAAVYSRNVHKAVIFRSHFASTTELLLLNPVATVQRLGSMRHCPGFKYNSVQFLSTNLSGY